MEASDQSGSMGSRVPALEKLIDVVAAGIGSIAGPLIAPWVARRRARAAIIAAKGQAEVQKILAASEADRLQITAQAQIEVRDYLESADTSTVPALSSEDIAVALDYQQQRRLRNIGAIADAAAAELGDESVSSENPDPDWTARFFSEAQEVSSAEMQQLWARVLAGEVRQPGKTSMRTLDLLRNMDPRAAESFKRLCSVSTALAVPIDAQVSTPIDLAVGYFDPTLRSLIVDQRVVTFSGNAASNSLRSFGLAFDTLNVLNEYGLIISDYNSWYDYKWCTACPEQNAPARMLLVHGTSRWVLVSEGAPYEGELKFSGVALTSSGRELASIVDIEPNPTYLDEYRSFLKGKKLTLHKLSADS